MDATNEAAQEKTKFFDASMHMIHITGFPRQQDVLVHPMEAPKAARLDVWQTDPDDGRHISGSLEGKAAFSTPTFELANSGNRTLRSPKRSWKISLEPDDGGKRLAGQARVNLKSMYNDPSQMREALAWHMFGHAAIPSPRHTYAKLAFDATYFGLFAVIEQVDKRFLKDHFGANHQGNLYKAYCGDVGCAMLEHRTGPDGDDSGRQYFVPGSDDHAYRLKTNGHDPEASSYDDLARFIKVINGVGLPGGTERFDTDAFRESVDAIMDTRTFLRWASVNVLLGSWDNYFKTPANYYLYNSGRRAPQEISCTRPISLSFPGTTTTAWVSPTTARSGSIPTSWTGRRTPAVSGTTTAPRTFRLCGTCSATVSTVSTISISWNT